MTIGEGKQFEKLVVYLPTKGQRTPAGLELVAISRAIAVKDFAIGNKVSTLNKTDLVKIGTTKKYKATKEFTKYLQNRAKETQQQTIDKITDLDTNMESKTYDGGKKFLLQWYNTLHSQGEDN